MTGSVAAFICAAYLYLVASSVAISKNGIRSEDHVDDNSFPTRHSEEIRTCSTALRQCKHERSCRDAMHNLKMKCVTRSGQCDAKMHDLPKCAEIMDTLNKHFNAEQRCSCGEKKPSHCALIHDTIYKNPCFASVKFLKERSMMPRAKGNNISKHSTDVDGSKSHDLIEELLQLGKDEHVVVTPLNWSTGQSKKLNDDPSSKNESLILNEDLSNFLHNQFHTVSVSKKNSEKENNNKANAESSSLIIHVFFVVVGLFFLVVLIMVGGLFLYCRLSRNERKKSKTAVTIP